MLIKHADGQTIDYSMIVHLPVYGDLVAVKSSKYKTEFSGNCPTVIFMELPDGTLIHTTDFVAEDNSLGSIIIQDEGILQNLDYMVHKMATYQLFPRDMLGAWVCHSEFTDHWTLGIDLKVDSILDEDCVCISPVKVRFMPMKESVKQ